MKCDIEQFLKSCWQLTLVLFCLAMPLAAKADRILNYETGEFFDGDLRNDDLLIPPTYIDDGEGATIEINLKYAAVEESPYYENCVTWFVPGSSWLRLIGKPELNCKNGFFILPEGYKSASLTILETEYKDFNFALQPTIPPYFYGVPTQFIDITPYEGFYPAQPVLINPQPLQKENDIWYSIFPVAYDYEHKIVRAYTRIKYRVDYQKEDPGIAGGDRILDYETGAFFEGDASNEEYRPKCIMQTNSTSTTMEFNVSHAAVEPSLYPFYENCVTWHIPTYGYVSLEGEPEYCGTGRIVDLPAGYKSVSVTILEEEYKDYNLALQPSIPPQFLKGPEVFTDITPYEGFKPGSPVDVNYESYRGNITATAYFNAIMYDYERQIVRAYSHIKLRLDYLEEEAGIEDVGADDAPVEYFNLQGIKVEKPEHGVYIERKCGKASKVVY